MALYFARDHTGALKIMKMMNKLPVDQSATFATGAHKTGARNSAVPKTHETSQQFKKRQEEAKSEEETGEEE